MLASFPGPTKLLVAYSMYKWGEPGIFSHVSMTKSTNGQKIQNNKAKFHVLFNELQVQHSVCITVAPR